MNPIIEKIYSLLPPKHKQRSNGWIYFNCPCCYHTENADTKMRGNIIFSDDSFVYQCFNCKFKAGFHLGGHLSKNTIQLLKDLGITSQELSKLFKMIEKYNETNDSDNTIKEKVIKREFRDIPENYKLIQTSLENGESHKSLNNVLNYIFNRNELLLKFGDLYWAEGEDHFLIPCYENGRIVGYSLRRLKDNCHDKYHHYIPQGYVYNYDVLLEDRKYQIFTEGQLCALCLNCCAVLSNEISEDRLKRILNAVDLDKTKLIIVPDRDKMGKKLIKQVIDQNLPFSVSFPNWKNGVKDVEENVRYEGRLYTLKKILDNVIDDKSKISLMMDHWC